MKKCFFFLLLIQFSYATEVWKHSNMYDKSTLTYYIPFELWLNTPWDGKKEKTDKKIQNTGTLSGYYDWYHPYLKQHMNVYKSSLNNNNELYTLSPKGISKVYDQAQEAYFNHGILFPAGYGWKINKLYTFSQEMWKRDKHFTRTIAIIITEISFDEKSNFQFLTYNFFINGKLHKHYKIYPVKK